MLYLSQGRRADAEAFVRRALKILEEGLGAHHPEVATVLGHLGQLQALDGRIDEAESSIRRALAMREDILGPDHPDVGSSLARLAAISFVRSDDTRTEHYLRRALSLRRQALGEKHPEIVSELNNLAFFLHTVERAEDAEAYVEQGLAILQRFPVRPDLLTSLYGLRARQLKLRGKTKEALAMLDRALDVAEKTRPQAGGSEETQAAFLASYTDLYQLMVRWQLESGDVDRALVYAERRRGRALLDQMAAYGIDWRASIPTPLREPLLKREARARADLAEWQQKIRLLPAAEGVEQAAGLRRAEQAYRDVYDEVRNASPLLQELRVAPKMDLATFQRELVSPRSLLLLYEIGEEASYLFLVPPGGHSATVLPLEISRDVGSILNLPAGPLTTSRLGEIFYPPNGATEASEPSGILSQLRGIVGYFPEQPAGRQLSDRLHALWQVLIPKALRQELLGCDEIVLIPDGVLHYLPFEALVVEKHGRGEPQYWLDQGPIVRYAPSVTALYRLSRTAGARGAHAYEEPTVLSLADPVFSAAEVAHQQSKPSLEGDANASRSAFLLAGRSLTRLPGTLREQKVIVGALGADRVQTLEGLGANEASLRGSLSGKRYLHLATHGLIDESGTSLFAALALTPPLQPEAAPQDDGLLQLHEIYDLKLPGCEMVVLSACRTNVGPDVVGEGVFALSRGFLVAGVPRVIASQWSVNDASTALLIGQFFRQIDSMAQQGPVDFARALFEARKVVRAEKRWSSPFHWAPFVYLGLR